MRLQLPKSTFLAGEGGQAEITLRNDSDEPVALAGSMRFGWGGVLLLDERGQRPISWPWASSGRGGPPRQTTVAPGQEVRAAGRFQTPPAEQAPGHAYTLRAPVSFIHPAPRDGAYTDWSHLAATLPLRVTRPVPAQRLQARLEADRTGWRLQVTDAAGRTPPGLLWGAVEIEAYRLSSGGPLPESSDGRWSEPWVDYAIAAQSPITIRVWAAAPGFVIAVATQTVPAPPLRRERSSEGRRSGHHRACGPWRGPSAARPNHDQIECAARLVAGRSVTERRGGFGMRRVSWRRPPPISVWTRRVARMPGRPSGWWNSTAAALLAP